MRSKHLVGVSLVEVREPSIPDRCPFVAGQQPGQQCDQPRRVDLWFRDAAYGCRSETSSTSQERSGPFVLTGALRGKAVRGKPMGMVGGFASGRVRPHQVKQHRSRRCRPSGCFQLGGQPRVGGGATVSLRDSPCTAVDVAALGHCRSPARPTRQRARAVGGRSNSATRPGRFCQRRFQPASPARPPWPAAEPLATQPAKPVSERQASNRRDSKPKESAFDCPSVGGSAGILQLQASSIVGHLQPAELSGLEDRWEHAEAEAVKEPGLRLQVPRRRRHLL